MRLTPPKINVKDLDPHDEAWLRKNHPDWLTHGPTDAAVIHKKSARTSLSPPEANDGPAQPKTTMNRNNFLKEFSQATGLTEQERIESASRGQFLRATNTQDIIRGQRDAGREKIRQLLQDPHQRRFWSGLTKVLGRQRVTTEEYEAFRLGIVEKNLSETTFPGLTLAEDTSMAVIDVAAEYGAYKELRNHPMEALRNKFLKVTALPPATWINPTTSQGTAISPDTGLTGASVSEVCNTVAVNLEASLELTQDEKVDWGSAVIEKISRGIAQAIDNAAFNGSGTADTANGGQTGIFQHASVPVVSAAPGNTSAAQLQHGDFINAIAAVAAPALQRPCRFWVHPIFLPWLLLLKDGNQFLCQTPAQSLTGEFTLCGFPMTLTAAAPSTITPGSPIAAFGSGEHYSVGIRQDIEIRTGQPKWNQAIVNIRAIMRVRCEMAAAEMFSVLKLAAS